MLRRCLAVPVRGGALLLVDKRVEQLELKWIGNAPIQPTLLGYIEGAPPIPSENLTESANYNGATSVELVNTEDLAFSWNRDQDSGLGATLSGFIGSSSEGLQLVPTGTILKAESHRAGFTFDVATGYSFLNQSSVSASSGSTASDRLELRGTPESDVKFPHLGRRFIPKNVGYAVIVSGLADVYVTRLSRTKRMVSYQVVPNPDIPLDINTITFLMNPAYTMNGSLDGMTGSSPTSDRFFPHVADMRAQYGSLYPASYYRIQEAYELKQQIEQQDKERETYFANFNSRLVDEAALARQTRQEDDFAGELPDGQQSNAGSLKSRSKQIKAEQTAKQKQIQAKVKQQDQQVHASASFAGWQKKMENLQIRAAKRNIVNTYVWDADGGLRAETQQFANTVEHTIGGSVNLEAAFGGEGEFAAGVGGLVTVELSGQATVHLTQTMTKTESQSRGFELNVDLSGVESLGITDYNDLPVLPGEKVSRYRFMSFYLEGSVKNFDDFSSQVVDPEWLQSNSEEARALRQVTTGTHKPWRILHRVTYVERPALMGFGRDLRPLLDRNAASETTHLVTRLDSLEQDNQELTRKLDQILGLLQKPNG